MSLLSSFKRFGPSGTRNKWPLPPTSHQLESDRLLLRIGQPLDWQAWRELREQSKIFLTPWEPSWPAEALTFDYYSGNLRRQWRDWKEGKAYAFLIFSKNSEVRPFSQFGQRSPQPQPDISMDPDRQKPPPRLVGGIALAQIERGAGQMGKLGYWIGAPFARQGFMTEAVRLVTGFGFETLALHRIGADCMPSNEPSKRLLSKLGFEQEGLAKSYLRINGVWEDHILWGLTQKDG